VGIRGAGVLGSSVGGGWEAGEMYTLPSSQKGGAKRSDGVGLVAPASMYVGK
jgi:hypothetical protein